MDSNRISRSASWIQVNENIQHTLTKRSTISVKVSALSDIHLNSSTLELEKQAPAKALSHARMELPR